MKAMRHVGCRMCGPPVNLFKGWRRCRRPRFTGRRGSLELLITRPFPLADFQKGLRGARDLLLECWRGHAPDWDAIRVRYNTTRRCVDCLQDKRKLFFTKPQWRASDDTRVCKECVAWHKDKKEPWRCKQCLQWQSMTCFPHAATSNSATWNRICNACHAARRCSRCAQLRSKADFSKHQWERTSSFCVHCAHRGKHHKRTPQDCFTACSLARARAFVKRSRQRMYVRAIKREIAALRQRKEQSSKTAKETGSEGAQTGADVFTAQKRARDPHPRAAKNLVPMFTHACPACGASVNSRLASGQIRIKHVRPDGRPCDRQSWRVPRSA